HREDQPPVDYSGYGCAKPTRHTKDSMPGATMREPGPIVQGQRQSLAQWRVPQTGAETATLPSSFTSFLIRVFLSRTMENEISFRRQQAGTLNMGKSPMNMIINTHLPNGQAIGSQSYIMLIWCCVK